MFLKHRARILKVFRHCKLRWLCTKNWGENFWYSCRWWKHIWRKMFLTTITCRAHWSACWGKKNCSNSQRRCETHLPWLSKISFQQTFMQQKTTKKLARASSAVVPLVFSLKKGRAELYKSPEDYVEQSMIEKGRGNGLKMQALDCLVIFIRMDIFIKLSHPRKGLQLWMLKR